MAWPSLRGCSHAATTTTTTTTATTTIALPLLLPLEGCWRHCSSLGIRFILIGPASAAAADLVCACAASKPHAVSPALCSLECPGSVGALCGGGRGGGDGDNAFFSVYDTDSQASVSVPPHPRDAHTNNSTTAPEPKPGTSAAAATAAAATVQTDIRTTLSVSIIIIILFFGVAFCAVACILLYVFGKGCCCSRRIDSVRRGGGGHGRRRQREEEEFGEMRALTRLDLISESQFKSFSRSEAGAAALTESQSTLRKSGLITTTNTRQHDEHFLAELQQELFVAALPPQHHPYPRSNLPQPIYIPSTALGAMPPQLQQSLDKDELDDELTSRPWGLSPSAASSSSTTQTHSVNHQNNNSSDRRDSLLFDKQFMLGQLQTASAGCQSAAESSVYMDVFADNDALELEMKREDS
ncbi:hypothetical protein HDU78_000721 [Chytriomyces hyalinus]|nr:hypothetical protein HDU78_000721 [Chytriomyces hyalinus]